MADSPFKLSRVSGQPITDAELVADLRRVAELLSVPGVSRPQYAKHGEYGATTVHERFGSWNKALVTAGLTIVHEVDISDERLFENLLLIWQHHGRQPRRNDLSSAPSTLSQGPYNRRFGSWTRALQAFVEYANSTGAEASGQTQATVSRPVTGRAPSLRLRWRVLQRDRFTCVGCGASPALTPGVLLHVDHIVPWSKEGQTVFENLQTLCSTCNLGKSNVHPG